MNFRTVILLLVVAAIAALAALNWGALSALSMVSLGVAAFEAPLGLIMLALTALLGVFFIAYVLSLQGSVLLEITAMAKRCWRSANWPTRPRHHALPICACFWKLSTCSLRRSCSTAPTRWRRT